MTKYMMLYGSSRDDRAREMYPMTSIMQAKVSGKKYHVRKRRICVPWTMVARAKRAIPRMQRTKLGT